MDDDEEDDGPAIGGRPKYLKKPNPLNELKRERQRQAKIKEEQVEVQQDEAEQGTTDGEQARQEHAQQVEGQSRIPSFGDGSQITKDWTTSGLFDDHIIQHEDTCGSVVFTRLLQASYNKDKPIAERLVLSYKDLAHYIKAKTRKNSFAFSNINIPINYIRNSGLHKDEKISGHGVKTKGDFDHQQEATKQFVYEKLESTALGIVVKIYTDFQDVEMGFYYVDAQNGAGDHALLVLAKGKTNEGIDFLVAENSWGLGFGNSGYLRIFLPENGRFKIFWPL